MSNRNYLLPSINPTVNAELKGDVTITGSLTVADNGIFTNDVTIGDDLTVTGTTTTDTLSIGSITSPYRQEQIEVFVPTIVSATAAVCVVTARIAGTITAISVVANAQPTVGPATFTCSLISGGVTTAITGGVLNILTTDTAGTAITVNPSAANVVAVGDVIQVLVGGTNTAAGTAHVSFQIRTPAT